MAQRLIVEGNDAIAIAVLCSKCGLKPPKGYANPLKFKEEFVKTGEGISGAIRQLRLSLSEPALTHIGLIVDADDDGAAFRWQQVRGNLTRFYDLDTLVAADAQTGAKVIVQNGMPTLGVWIMPDNSSRGYLEHFLSAFIPTGNEIWSHAQSALDDLMEQPYNVLTGSKRQKALLHTWLAWQRNPGKPFGQAIEAGYFDTASGNVQPFLDWFAQTFELEP